MTGQEYLLGALEKVASSLKARLMEGLSSVRNRLGSGSGGASSGGREPGPAKGTAGARTKKRRRVISSDSADEILAASAPMRMNSPPIVRAGGSSYAEVAARGVPPPNVGRNSGGILRLLIAERRDNQVELAFPLVPSRPKPVLGRRRPHRLPKKRRGKRRGARVSVLHVSQRQRPSL